MINVFNILSVKMTSFFFFELLHYEMLKVICLTFLFFPIILFYVTNLIKFLLTSVFFFYGSTNMSIILLFGLVSLCLLHNMFFLMNSTIFIVSPLIFQLLSNYLFFAFFVIFSSFYCLSNYYYLMKCFLTTKFLHY